jgi:hypothetical protein
MTNEERARDVIMDEELRQRRELYAVQQIENERRYHLIMNSIWVELHNWRVHHDTEPRYIVLGYQEYMDVRRGPVFHWAHQPTRASLSWVCRLSRQCASRFLRCAIMRGSPPPSLPRSEPEKERSTPD